MKFRFYITDLFDGKIVGTDSEDAAREHANCPEFFVVDTDSGMWLTEDGGAEAVTAATLPEHSNVET